MASHGSRERPDQEGFIRILLDEPVPEEAKLGFDAYADVLTNIILSSESPFTIGIFGDWGTGKTTLMRMIEDRVSAHTPHGDKPAGSPTVIPVWFDAWRYEREKDLIAPLLGAILDQVDQYKDQGLFGDIAEKFKALERGFLRGLIYNLGLVQFTPEKLVEEIDSVSNALPGASEYREAYEALRGAVEDFASADEATAGQNKFVIFVDDLDRCLPEAALQVLEATKVFLDFPGMVYVLGLNREIVQRCIEEKYRGQRGNEPYGPHLGKKYVEKIIQLPFSIPPGTPGEMSELVETFAEEGKLPEELREPFQGVAEPSDRLHREVYLDLADLDDIPLIRKRYEVAVHYLEHKPREMKRLLNAYIVSAAIARGSIERAPPDSPVQFTADLVLSLLVLRFLDESTYNRLTRNPEEERERLFWEAAATVAPLRRTAAPSPATGDNSSCPPSNWRNQGSDENGDQPRSGEKPEGPPEDEDSGSTAPALPRLVAQLLLHTRLLEASPHEIQLHARATSATAEPEAGPTQGAPTLDEALRMLRSDDLAARTTGVWALARMDEPGAMQALLGALSHEDLRVRTFAAMALGDTGDASAVQPLVDLLHDPHEGVRRAACTTLGRIGDSSVVAPLVEALGDPDPTFQVAGSAASALAEIGGVAVLNSLKEALLNSRGQVRYWAAQALGQLGDDRAVEALIAVLEHDQDDDVRASVAYALGSLGDRRAIKPLVTALDDDSEEVRGWVAGALGAMGAAAERALPKLSELAQGDPDPDVRTSAMLAIQKIETEPGSGSREQGRGAPQA